MLVVALDGPAGTGKSTVARAVAERLGLHYLDTGAMYRAVTWAALRDGLLPGGHDDQAVVGDGSADLPADLPADLLADLVKRMELRLDPATGAVVVDGTDVRHAIRGPRVTAAVSAVSAVPAVRAELRHRQREWAVQEGGGVVEGRDVGTVVFPDAALKVFLTARAEVRAARRAAEVGGDVAEVAADILRRDRADSTRADSPLAQADDAVVVDTSDLTLDEVVDRVEAEVRARAPVSGWGP
jgi:cytidylate kinase